MRLAFPAAQLVAMAMDGGPVADRHRATLAERTPGAVLELEYTPEELIAMRRWWLAQAPEPSPSQQRAREACLAAIYLSFQGARQCLICGRALPSAYHRAEPPFCADCVNRA